MESKLLVVFNNVNEWLRFAEAKNAMIIALNGVVIFGLAKIIEVNVVKEYNILKWYLFIAFLFLIISTFVALLSFVPQLKPITPGFNFKKNNHSYLFFDSLKDRTVDDITKRYALEGEQVEDFHKHLADQIITNARITKRKYDYFTFACWMTIAAILTPIIAIMYALYTYSKS